MLAVLFTFPSAQAGTKEELIRVQNEVRILQNQFLEFSENYNERFGGMHSLLIQLLDQVAKFTNNLSRMDVALNNQTEGARTQDKSLLNEFQEMREMVSSVATSLTVLTQQFNEYKLQAAMRAESSVSGLSASSMFGQAQRDYLQGDFELAIEGFTVFIENFPEGEQAARAQLYIGESSSALNDLKGAVEAFTRVIDDYPQASVVPTALFKRARNETALQQRDNAIADFKDILDRFPNASEADLARSELQLLENAQKPKAPAKQTTPARKTATGR